MITNLLDRRRFLVLAGGATATTLGAQALWQETAAAAELDPAPFPLGVASADPDASSVALWTRLANDPAAGGGMPDQTIKVGWEVARDEGFKQVVRSGVAQARPDRAHSVQVVADKLRPDTWYWYRFSADGRTSRVGRTRTLPLPQQRSDRLRFAFASCAAWAGGRYAAYRDLAEQDLDLVLHLGDYIYETAAGSLAEFRRLHALYKSSPDLREAHARFPFITVWDDHEVLNNWADDHQGSPDGTPWIDRQSNAFQAYYEHLPMRTQPKGPDWQVYRRFRWGRLAEFSVLDTRQYRSDQACGDGMNTPPCDEMYEEDRTLTGPEQERWLLTGLKTSNARWNVIAQQTIFAKFDYDLGPGLAYNLDQWDGYPAARQRILDTLATHRPSNPVIIGGDSHSAWVNDVLADFDDPGPRCWPVSSWRPRSPPGSAGTPRCGRACRPTRTSSCTRVAIAATRCARSPRRVGRRTSGSCSIRAMAPRRRTRWPPSGSATASRGRTRSVAVTGSPARFPPAPIRWSTRNSWSAATTARCWSAPGPTRPGVRGPRRRQRAGPSTDRRVTALVTGDADAPAEQAPAFAVRLDNFEGPFDLLLSLISKHKLDITEVALSRVTDEFIAHVKAAGPEWDLEQTSSFLLVAATLLDLKAARLLPQGDVEDEEDLALLEARDLLFARLLQYRAFKQVAAVLESRLAGESRRHPRAVGLEERFANLLPEVLIGIGLEQFAHLAARAMEPKPVLEVSLQHIHMARVSVREQAGLVVERLRRSGTMTFRALCGDSPDRLTTVARFLSLLELFREGAVAFDQMTPLGELSVRWTGSDEEEFEIDEFEGAPAEADAPAPPAEDADQEQGEGS